MEELKKNVTAQAEKMNTCTFLGMDGKTVFDHPETKPTRIMVNYTHALHDFGYDLTFS
nr:agamous-like MADS-box protein AGL61 [Ipomoea trifida]